LLEGNLFGLRDVARKGGPHQVAEFRAQHDRVELLVVQEAAPVEVGRADRRPDAVDHDRLRMQQCIAALVDDYAVLQQLVVVGPPGVEHQRRIGLAGQHQPYVDPASHGRLQRGQQLRIGHEVGTGEPDLGLGAGNRRQQGHVDQAVGIVGRTADGAHDIIADRLQRRIEIERWQRLASLLLPGRQEELLQLRNYRSIDLQVGVAPRRLTIRASLRPPVGRAAGVHAADVDAAEESRPAVHDEELAVVALVDVPPGLGGRRVDRVELQRADAVVAQPLEVLGGCAKRAHAVVDQVHLHALLLLLDQGIHEALADLVILEDVGLQVDVVARRQDGREHRAISVRSVLQQPDPVAGQQRAVGHGLLHCEVTVENTGVLGTPLELRQDRLAASRRKRPSRAFDLRR